MERHRVTLMFIAILVCVPVLALYQFGFFPEMATWLQGRLPRLLVLPEGGLKRSLALQYSYYTVFAFVGAWMGQSLGALWHKFAFLLSFTYLTLSLTITLAWTGIIFEPFSGILAAWLSCLAALMVADAGLRSETLAEKAPPLPSSVQTAVTASEKQAEKTLETDKSAASASVSAQQSEAKLPVEISKKDDVLKKEEATSKEPPSPQSPPEAKKP